MPQQTQEESDKEYPLRNFSPEKQGFFGKLKSGSKRRKLWYLKKPYKTILSFF
ncbi:hypothetical protein [Methylomonas sp.]|jgi:hypothetical protein|uniref:hypothetical protein n=1 Tax=Methylomonas sp. TaxID=418 RepID=UPI0025E1E94F|nr:hypothetical protein [Methylomonas sp.]